VPNAIGTKEQFIYVKFFCLDAKERSAAADKTGIFAAFSIFLMELAKLLRRFLPHSIYIFN